MSWFNRLFGGPRKVNAEIVPEKPAEAKEEEEEVKAKFAQAEAGINLATTERERQQKRKALMALVDAELARRVAEKTGDPASPHYVGWVAAINKHDHDKAFSETEKALQIVPNSPFYLALRGMTRNKMKDYGGAHADLVAALEHQKEAPPVLAGATNEAINNLQTILKAEALEIRNAARELGKKKQFRESIALLDLAVTLEPENATNFFLRGLTYTQIGYMTTAFHDVSHALELDPNYPDGQPILESLKKEVTTRAA